MSDPFYDVVQSLDDVVWFADPDGTLRYVNPAVERIYGRSPEEFHGDPGLWLDVVDPRDRATAARSAELLAEQGAAHVEYRIVRPDGRTFWIHDRKSVIRDSTGAPQRICGIATDVTARREAEESARRQEMVSAEIRHLQSRFIADASPREVFDGLLRSLLTITESEYGFIGEILRAADGKPSLKTHAITNIAWNEETRRFCDENAPSGLLFTNLETLFGRVITTGEPVIANDPERDPRRGGLPDGHPSVDAFLGIPLYATDELVGMAGLANREGGYDEGLLEFLSPWISMCAALLMAYRLQQERARAVRELKEKDVQLQQMSRLTTMGEMLAGIAHEINQPLTAIANLAGACRRTLEKEPPHDLDRLIEWSESIGDQAVRCGEIIRRLRAFARRGDVVWETIGLNELLVDTVALIRSDALDDQVEVRLEPSNESPMVHGIVIQLKQVFVNLLRNACEAVAGCPQRLVTVRAETVENFVEVSVVDTGPGIPADIRDTLFHPFVSDREGGLGIGLAISESVVERHGGRIWVDPEVDEGTVVRVSLPRLQHKDGTRSSRSSS